MSQNNTNRDIRRFETDADGNTTRVLLNTDEPLGLLDGDYQEQLEELENRLNAITGGAYSNTVQIGHGGTGAESAEVAMSNLVTALDVISSLNQNTLSFVAQQTGGSTSTIGKVYRVRQDAVAEQIGALKASNNLSDLQNTLTGLQNLYHNVPIAEPQGGIPLKAWFDDIYVMLGLNVSDGGVNYHIEPNCYTLKSLVDNYLSEYLLKASNNLSDLSDLSTALGNLLNDVDTFEPAPGPPIYEELRNLELYLGIISGPPYSPLTIPKKLTVEYLYENYILPVLNTEYGMTKDAGTGLYGFTGNAATADVADVADGVGVGAVSNKYEFRSLVSNNTPALTTGDYTVTLTDSDEFIVTGISIIGQDSSAATYVLKDYSVSYTSSQNIVSETNITVTVTASSIPYGGAINGFKVNVIGMKKS